MVLESDTGNRLSRILRQLKRQEGLSLLMTVYVDNAKIKYRGSSRHHLMADSRQELHEFAQRIGLKRCWFQRDHYDVTSYIRRKAVLAGAIEVSSEYLIGLRRQKRLG